jgi:hypothetical protein
VNILWFGVNAGLVPSFRLEAELAQGLSLLGDQVTRIGCRGIFGEYCPVMMNESLFVSSERRDKERVCRDCRAIGRAADDSAAFPTVFVEDFTHPEDHAAIAEVLEHVTSENWRNLEVQGIPVGRYAAYLTMLHYKAPDVAAREDSWEEYRSDLRYSLLMVRVLPRIFDAVQPTHAMVYNPLYPTNRMFTELATRSSLPLISISTGGYVPDRLGTVAIYPHISSSQTVVDSATIRSTMVTPCSSSEVFAVESHIRGLIAGEDPWVYSTAPSRKPPQAIRTALGIAEGRHVVVALVASPDETRSSALVDAEYERVPGGDISDVREFVEVSLAFAVRNPDLDVVIRLHPRLAPNKREQVLSPDLLTLFAMLDNRPVNAHINEPGDGLGLYDVMRIADVGLNQSSSSGLELLAFGIPVVHYDPPRMNSYPPEFGYVVARHSDEELDRTVRLALADGPQAQRSVDAFRWYTATLLRSLVHQSPLPERPTIPTTPWVSSPPSRMRALIPEAWRYRVARWQARRREETSVRPSSVVHPWVVECRERIVNLGPGPVWNPETRPRGKSSMRDEDEIAFAVSRLRHDVGW